MLTSDMQFGCVIAGKITDFSNADVAVDQYHLFNVINLNQAFLHFCQYILARG